MLAQDTQADYGCVFNEQRQVSSSPKGARGLLPLGVLLKNEHGFCTGTAIVEEILTVYWIKIGATLLVFGGLMALFIRQSGQIAEGEISQSVREVLQGLGSEYDIFEQVTLRAQHGMSTIDYVMVSPYGIFVISICRYSGVLFGDAKDGEWLLKSGRQKEIIYSPLWENRKHSNALEAKLGKVKMIPVVVLVNARMKGESDPRVVRLKNLTHYMMRQKSGRISEEVQTEIKNKLKSVL